MKTVKFNVGIFIFWITWYSLGKEYFKTEPKEWVSAFSTPVICMGLLIAFYKVEQFFEPVDEAGQKERLDGYLFIIALFLLMVTGNLITEVTYLGSYPALFTAITLAMICITWVWVGRDTIQRVRSNRHNFTSEYTGKSDDS